MIVVRGDFQGPRNDGEAGSAAAGTRVASNDDLLLNRCRVLMDSLAEAQDEMSRALMAGDVATACAAARRLASVGWLFREAADKFERSTE